mgnify:CR=1 FL=1
MAEENNTEDIEKVEAFLQSKIKAEVEAAFNSYSEQQKTQPITQQTDNQKDQLKELINPYIEPGIQRAQFEGADAKDYAQFYMRNADASEYADEVEKSFEALAKAGRPTTRADILRYIRGKEMEADPAAFMTKMAEKQKAQVDKAKGAVDFGSSAADRAKNDPTFANFDKLSVEDMEKALDGVAF